MLAWIRDQNAAGAKGQSIGELIQSKEHTAKLEREVARLREEVTIQKSDGLLRDRPSAEKYAWIKGHTGEFSVSAMIRVLKVHRSCYYDCLKRPDVDDLRAERAEIAKIQKEADGSCKIRVKRAGRIRFNPGSW